MVKSTILCGSLLSLLLIAGLVGCSNPKANPVTPPPEFRDGIPLDVNATRIPYSPTPYKVSQDWIIPAGRQVTIEPGVEIMFDSLWWIDVEGQILAEGTESQPIIFTSAHLHPQMGQWRGFKLKNSTDASSFKHCIFSWGAYYDTDTTNVIAQTFRGMLAMQNSSPVIENCVIIRNQNNAIYMTGAGCHPTIRYNIFTKNDASAVRVDTTVLLPDVLGQPNTPDVSFNCVGDNSALPFLMGYDSTRYGFKALMNQNLDSCDIFFNIDMSPLLAFQSANANAEPPDGWARDGSDLGLQSCSPCIDAGPEDEDFDSWQTRADMGTKIYAQPPGSGELRGVISGRLDPAVRYNMSCNVRVNPGSVLVIPAGTQITAIGLYAVEVYGKLVVEDGGPGTRASITVDPTDGEMWNGLKFFNTDTLVTPSEIRGLNLSHYKQLDVFKPGMVFENCRFDHGRDYGMLVSTHTPDEPDTVRIANCTFSGCGTYAVKVDSSAVTIRNSLITESAGRGIWLNYTGSAAHITNCVVTSNTTIGLVMENFSSPVVTNNVFARNGYHGIDMNNNCRPEIRNNIIYKNSRWGVHAVASSFPLVDHDNVFGHFTISGSDTTFEDYVPAGIAHDGTNMSVEPVFVSPTDYHLAAGSPCANAGNPDPAYNDADGSQNDMGAYGGPNGGGVGAGNIRQTHGGLASK